jgi:hypothetical protein
MQIPFVCPVCSTQTNYTYWQDLQPLANSYLYKVTCPNGHTSEFALRNFKYALLFEIGLSALAKGYHREAASSFATALERFYEYSIGVLLMHKFSAQTTGMFDEQAIMRFDKLWKTGLKLSERQLGAFYALYFNEFDEAPVMLDEAFSKSIKHSIIKNPVNFRNRIVHEGYIPSYEEAFQYGEAVSKYMLLLINIYADKDKSNGAQDGIDRSFYMAFFEEALADIRMGKPVTRPRYVTATSSFLSQNTGHYATPISLRNYLKQRQFQ